MTKLPPYNPEAKCPKCGGEEAGVYWVPKGRIVGTDSPHGQMYQPYDALRRRCETCGYEWEEAPCDKGKAKVGSTD